MQNKAAVLEQIRDLVVDLSPEERLSIIQSIATVESTDDMIDDVEMAERHRLLAEQEAWFARPASERNMYRGKFIAIHEGKVVDSDAEQRALVLRIHARFGNTPVLILNGDWDKMAELTIHSTYLVS